VSGPSRVEFTKYAEDRAVQRGLSSRQVADLVLEQHERRRRNPRQADWVVRGRGLGVAYNWPDRGDRTTALVVTVWSE
jgi:hypothetical protein